MAKVFRNAFSLSEDTLSEHEFQYLAARENVPASWGKHFLPREIAKLCYEAGWIDVQNLLIAGSICIAESNGYEKRRGPVNADGSIGNADGSVDRGLWQINNKAHPSITDAMCDDPRQATAIARSIYNQRGFEAWSSYTNGQYAGPRAMGYMFDGVANFLRLKNGYVV